MRKTSLITIFSTIILLSGCSFNSNPDQLKFQAEKFIPPTAQKVEVKLVDFQSDERPEQAVVFTNEDILPEGVTKQQHLWVYEFKGGIWQPVFRASFANTNVPTETYLAEVTPLDLNNDGRQELFVKEVAYRGDDSYFVLAFQNGAYRAISPEKNIAAFSYTEPFIKLKGDEREIKLTEIIPTLEGIKETYAIFCAKDMAGKPMATQYEQSCRQERFVARYDGAGLKRVKDTSK